MTTQFLPERLYAAGIIDLVSVTPPGAQLTPTSKIDPSQTGKCPGRRLPNGLWAGYNWRGEDATAEQVRQWCLDGANVGLRTDRFPAVDIDCMDPRLAQQIEDCALAMLGPAPIRVGRAPKRLLLYRTAEPFSRMRLWIKNGDVHHLVEVLGQGQQFVVHGTHPRTLQPFSWGVYEQPLVAGPEALTEITREQVDAFLTELAARLDLVYVVEREGDGRPITRTAAADQTGLRAPSMDVLREAVRLIPNTNEFYPDRTSYLRVGYAIRAAGADDEEEAFAIFAEWAAKWEGNDRAACNDPDTVRADWRRMRGPYSLGWGWIAGQARAFGFNDAALEFEITDDAPTERPETAPEGSDQWLADTVVARQRGRLRFVPQTGRFLVWNEGHWVPDAELLAEDVIKRELRAVANAVLLRGATDKEKKASAQLANAICSAGKVPAVGALVKSDRAIAVSVDSLDHNPWTLCTPGGLVDLRTGALGPSDPDALSTKVTAVPPDFGGACPEWLRFLDEACGGDEALVGYLRRLCGYCLTGSTDEQHVSFIFGPGGNGKSVFLNVLSGILGDYSHVASMDTFTASYGEKHSTDVASMVGARLVSASETSSGKRWDETRVKSLSGGEPVSARFMRQDNFTFQPSFKLVFIGNHRPETRDVDDAMRRRIQMVPFTVRPARVDKQLGAKLRQEWPAILAWMIAGCLLWQQEGLAPPARVKASTDEYFGEEDAVGRWLRECCVAGEDENVTTAALFESWREWANRNGEYVGSTKRLSQALIARRFERWQDGTTRKMGFKGLRIENRQDFEIGA